MSSGLRRLMIPELHRFMTPELHMFMTSYLHRFTTWRLCRFMIPDLHRFNHPETDSRFTRRSQIRLSFSHITWKLISWNSTNPTFRGCEVFPEFPNTSPSGKRVDSDNLIPQKLLNSGKNVTLGTSEWTHVFRKTRNGRIEETSWNYPLAPINRELSPKKFSPLPRFSPNFCLRLREKVLRDKRFEASILPQLSKVLLSLFFYYHLLPFIIWIREFYFVHFCLWKSS
jgi:hypothetical protein